MSLEGYEFSLEGSYMGPLDLLYLLMKKEEIAFEKISISKITDQYLEYIHDLKNVDLSYAGDFLALASRLMLLKTKELLPKAEQSDENLLDFEIEREALILQMEEYQKFKRVACGLQKLEEKNFGTYGRGRLEKITKDSEYADISIWQLFKAFNKTLQTHSYNSVHTIKIDNDTLKDREQYINLLLTQSGRVMFDDLLGKDHLPIITVVTFIAVLELTKTDNIVFRQSEVNGPLWIYRKKQNDEYKEELAQEKKYYTEDPIVLDGLVDYLHGRRIVSEIEETKSIDSVLKNVVQLVENGIKIEENDIQTMLEGKNIMVNNDNGTKEEQILEENLEVNS